MTQLCYLFILGPLVARAFAADPALPLAMTWSIALYPGETFRSHLLAPRICSNVTLSPNACFASAGKLYTIESSTTAVEAIIHFPAATDYSHGGLQVQGTQGIGALDQMNIRTSDGLRNTTTMLNVTIAVHDDFAALYLCPSITSRNTGLGLSGYCEPKLRAAGPA
ncbi:uncharacterized protein PAC_12787 [Phialocephala subalpina]|uniref:Uncharacterized protein n=1 Tax=Phialocephala subalpina TaxID=576137 RepID=A0A1L7XCX1_9HELO|nr:uncharacterized protein PAC_12787 [Phialocephala subalpina]